MPSDFKLVSFALVAAIGLHFASAFVGQLCMTGWLEHGTSCYLFSLHHKNWTDAFAYCRSKDAKLVEVESLDENTFLQTNVKRIKPSDFWIGGTDLNHVGTWRWATTNNPLTFTDWDTNQPELNDEYCMELKQGYNYRWNNEGCHQHKNFICEL